AAGRRARRGRPEGPRHHRSGSRPGRQRRVGDTPARLRGRDPAGGAGRVSRPAPRPLSAALQPSRAALAPACTLARVQEIWERAVGPAIAAAAHPSAERDGVLTVTCAAAVWAHELDLMASELLPRLNAALGAQALTQLRCRSV